MGNKTIHRLAILIFFVMSWGFTIFAQRRVIQINVVEALTKRPFDGINTIPVFEIRNVSDSSIVAKSIFNGIRSLARGQFKPQKYIVKAYAANATYKDNGTMTLTQSDKYDSQWIEIDLSGLKDNEVQWNGPTVYLNLKKAVKLNEVTVTASKVMFYHKGDTLIYNADAFVLAEGSMLDALIDQLPGVKLSSNGVITVNGRFVDKLLLNGKDIFNGNRELMLENLAAYTVKDIAVYDKLGRLSDLLEQNMKDSRYVMDVRMKREYSHGFFLNAEAGYGTHDRYLGKLFGMWFSDNVSMTAYAGANNLSDESKPGKDDGAWSRDKMGSGVKTKRYGGITYLVQGLASRWEMKGNLDVVNSEMSIREMSATQNYLSGSDIYNYRHKDSRNRSISISSKHELFYKYGNLANINFCPKFNYTKTDNKSHVIEIMLDDEIKNLSQSLMESIYNDASNYCKTALNRSLMQNLTKGNTIAGSAEAWADIRLNASTSPTLLTIKGSTNLHSHNDDAFSRYTIKSADETNPHYDKNRYFRNRPNRNDAYAASASLRQYISSKVFDGALRLTYDYTRLTSKNTSELYMLNEIPDYDGFGTLPSVTDYMPTFSPGDSYACNLTGNHHRITPSVDLGTFYEDYKDLSKRGAVLMFSVGIPLEFVSRKFHYDGRGIDERISNNELLVNAYISGTWFLPQRWTLDFSIGTHETSVDLLNKINVQNITDPLNIYIGNPDLSNSRTNRVEFSVKSDRAQLARHKFGISGLQVSNALARDVTYNPKDGTRIYKPYNINGNWNANGYYSFITPFINRKMEINATTTCQFYRSVDLSSISTANSFMEPTRRKMNTLTAGEEFEFSWQTGRHRLGALADVRVNRYTSSDEGFTDFTSLTAKYGASGVLNLPRNWGLSTDMTLYTRRGFTDRQLNTTDLVWNARATKSILNGSVVFVVDAYDLLRQLTNVTYTINAQARTETVSNVIPAYVLFHIQYRWNKQPKR